MVNVVELRGCIKCRLVFWFYVDEKHKDCKECGNNTKVIMWCTSRQSGPPKNAFIIDEDS